jgi:hypothetical protein
LPVLLVRETLDRRSLGSPSENFIPFANILESIRHQLMHTEDHLTSPAFHLERPLNPDQSSEPAETTNEPVFPAELLNSGFELTNILAS